MKNYLKYNFKRNSGFTLLEVVIALFLITVGLISVYSMVNYFTSSARFSKNKLIASQLSQEGIEVVRNIRDQNWMDQNLNWLSGMGDGAYIPIFYNTEGDDPSKTWSLFLITDLEDEITRIYAAYDSDDKFLFYGQAKVPKSDSSFPADWRNTLFTRRIRLIYDVTKEALEIVSNVNWTEAGKTYRFEIKDYLYDWQVPLSSCPLNFSPGFGNPEGTSYYSDEACMGQEIVMAGESPFRGGVGDSAVCIKDYPAEDLIYTSFRDSEAICYETADIPILGQKVTNPF